MPFAIPVAMSLLQCIGVGGYGYLSSLKVSLMILVSISFRNIAPNYASADDAATNLSIWHRVNIAPLRCMGCLSCGFHPRKKFTDTRLLASIADN